MHQPELTDEALLRLIAQRDGNAVAELYDRHAQTIFNLIMRILQEPATADEVLQETFWQVWQKAGEFRSGGSAAGWIYRIARNKSLDQLRRQKARPQPVAFEATAPDREAEDTLSAAGPTVERIAEQTWQRQHVRQALASLPAEQRHCLELAYFEGMSQREIAAFTQTSMGTVKTRVRLGMEKMARLLRGAGYQAEDLEL